MHVSAGPTAAGRKSVAGATYEIEISKAWEQFCKLSFTEHPERISATFDSKYLTADELTHIYRSIYRRKREGLACVPARN